MKKTPTFSINLDLEKSPISILKKDNFSKNDSNILKHQHDQLLELKEQYLRYKSQCQQEQKEINLTILNLERQLRQEMQKIEELEIELQKISKNSQNKNKNGSIDTVEKIWNIMNIFHEKIHQNKISIEDFKPKIEEKMTSKFEWKK